ncbi:hypothetical protein AAFF_G00172390 [Aldrovandia affinis]|uniref:SCP domain-containing protein n=1 Tax=Aldrovandia affinis TaxID=143900 RepID=A0AAD7SYW8_9TELE|nr:hypothetical protein AAFF_G00172390 [Aldrovandia affinis]
MAQLPSLMLRLAVLMDSIVRMQSADGDQLPDITDQGFIDICVKVHNSYRSNVDPPASDMRFMTWDEALAKSARAWARSCKFSHNPLLGTTGKLHPEFAPVGENIWVGESVSKFRVEKAIQKWYDEVTDYEYSSRACTGKQCGHYTQVVWAKSYKVGCAVQVCPNGIEGFSKRKSANFVCNYGEAGNINGVHPYKRGKACSACGGNRCQDRLCRDTKRDESESTSSASCKEFSVAVLVTRPLSLLLIFAGVYGLQFLYPNLFAYE